MISTDLSIRYKTALGYPIRQGYGMCAPVLISPFSWDKCEGRRKPDKICGDIELYYNCKL